jgi:hypothetical protein
MDWSKLKTAQCPKCFASLKNTGTLMSPFYSCGDSSCTFKIGGARFDEITENMQEEKPVYRKRHFLSDNMMQSDSISKAVQVSNEED